MSSQKIKITSGLKWEHILPSFSTGSHEKSFQEELEEAEAALEEGEAADAVSNSFKFNSYLHVRSP